MTKEIKKMNILTLSGQVYSDPIEITGKNKNQPGEWIIRKVKIAFDNSQWIDLVFEDIEMWNKYKRIKIGYYIEAEGILRNYFNRISKTNKPQMQVVKILHTQPIKTTETFKFIMSKELITERKAKKDKS